MTVLAMIRHGPTAWNDEQRLQGHTDVPLSPEGREAVSRWRVPDDVRDFAWVSSPLRRAMETAALLGREDPELEPRIMEMAYGEWEGQRLPDLRRALGREMAENEARGLDFRPPGGESPRELQARLGPWLRDVAGRPRPVFAVSHHGVLRALVSLATGWTMAGPPPERIGSGAVHYFELDSDGAIRVARLNVSMEPS